MAKKFVAPHSALRPLDFITSSVGVIQDLFSLNPFIVHLYNNTVTVYLLRHQNYQTTVVIRKVV